MLVYFVTGRKVIAHFLRSDGKTVCGLSPRIGNKWVIGKPDGTGVVCSKCKKRLERSRILSLN